MKSTPNLVSVGTGGEGVPWFAAVGAEACVEATTTFLLVKGCTRAAGGVDVHGGGGRVGEGLPVRKGIRTTLVCVPN